MFTNSDLQEAFELKNISFNNLQFNGVSDLLDFIDYIYAKPGIAARELSWDKPIFFYEYRAGSRAKFQINEKYLNLTLKEYLFLNLDFSTIQKLDGKINKFRELKTRMHELFFLNSAGGNLLQHFLALQQNSEIFSEHHIKSFNSAFVCHLTPEDFAKIDKQTYSHLFDKYWGQAQYVCPKLNENPMTVATFNGNTKLIEYLAEYKKAKAVYEKSDSGFSESEHDSHYRVIKYEELAPIYRFTSIQTLNQLIELGLVPNLQEAIQALPEEFFRRFLKYPETKKSSIDELLILIHQHGFDFDEPFIHKGKSGDFLEDFIKQTYPNKYDNIKQIIISIKDRAELEKRLRVIDGKGVNSYAMKL